MRTRKKHKNLRRFFSLLPVGYVRRLNMPCNEIHNHRLCIQVWSGHIHTIRCLSEFHEARATKKVALSLW